MERRHRLVKCPHADPRDAVLEGGDGLEQGCVGKGTEKEEGTDPGGLDLTCGQRRLMNFSQGCESVRDISLSPPDHLILHSPVLGQPCPGPQPQRLMPFGWSSASKKSAWERESMGRKVIKVGSSHPMVSFRVRGTFPLLPQWG